MLVPPRLLLCTTTVLLLPVCCAITAVESTAGCLAVTITVEVPLLLLLLSATHYSAVEDGGRCVVVGVRSGAL